MPLDIHAPALHACAYDAGHAAGQRDQAAGRPSAALALEGWLHQGANRNDYATSFLSGYEAGLNRMNTINNLRDRLLLRLLSQPTRDALFRVVMSSIDAEINHYACNDDPEHIALPLCHLADLMEEQPQWVAELTAATANG